LFNSTTKNRREELIHFTNLFENILTKASSHGNEDAISPDIASVEEKVKHLEAQMEELVSENEQ